jgi:hypothetical protein
VRHTGAPTASPASTISAATIDRRLIDTRLLDCWEVNLAIALTALGVEDIRSLLGSQWTLRLEASGAVALDVEDQFARLARVAGVDVATTPLSPGLLVETCARVLADGGVPLVVSDAVVMPWTPYLHRRSVEHSMVVTSVDHAAGAVTFTDGYDNRTEWGDAVPVDGELRGPELAAVETCRRARVVAVAAAPHAPAAQRTGTAGVAGVDRIALLRETTAALDGWTSTDPFAGLATRARTSMGDVTSFAAFCEVCWTIERRRALFSRWLRDVTDEAGPLLPDGFADRFQAEVAGRWAMVNRFAYLALRRLRGGRPADAGRIAELVTAAGQAETALARCLADTGAESSR